MITRLSELAHALCNQQMSVLKKENTMKKFFLLVPLLFGLNMVLVGCDKSNRPTSQTSSTPSASKMSDSDLEQAIRAKFDSDAQLKEAKLDVMRTWTRTK